jgi:hypothetical protein
MSNEAKMTQITRRHITKGNISHYNKIAMLIDHL